MCHASELGIKAGIDGDSVILNGETKIFVLCCILHCIIKNHSHIGNSHILKLQVHMVLDVLSRKQIVTSLGDSPDQDSNPC